MPDGRARLLSLLVVLAAGVLVLAGCGDGGADLVEDAGAAAADHSYTIPPGAGEALDDGEPLAILPAELAVRVGEVIEIVNDDVRGHLVGPFFVGAHETLRQRFASEGSYEGECSVHPSGTIVIAVT